MASTPRRPSVASTRHSGASTSDRHPDTIVGDFKRGKEIGKGSFATVFLAQHVLADLSQFMKKRVQLSTLPETRDIFDRYPNQENGGLNEVLSRHFAKQIVSALEYLRSRNLIHRDIKPQNLLLNPSPIYMSTQTPQYMPLTASASALIPNAGLNSLPMLKVADFGFARHLPSTAMAETLCGSPLYMAPEILRYEKYDARADLWSTGAVLYEMVVGKPPFRAQNHVDLLRRIEKQNDQITFDRNLPVSREMKNCIRSLLKKDPRERVSYERFFQDPLVTSPIPGLVTSDKAVVVSPDEIATPDMSSRNLDKDEDESPEQRFVEARTSFETPERALRADNAQNVAARRKSSSGSLNQNEEQPEVRRRSSQRRPSMVAHATAPARQELHAAAAPRMERRASRSSPLAGPPMVREQSTTEMANNNDKTSRAQREKVAQDVADEREYVLIDGNHVKVNAIADEFEANAMHGRGNSGSAGAMARRATVQGHPGDTSRGMQIDGRYGHHRNPSFDKRLGAPSPQSATNMLTKALNAANARLFGALGTSPPFGKAASPPTGYSAFPPYLPPVLAPYEASESKAPIDEEMKIVRTMEEAAHRSDVIYGFAEVKFRQLLPATPSTQDALGIQQLDNPERDDEEELDKDMTNIAIVNVAEEALVLYVKTLAILAKTIDLAGYWWNKHSRGDAVAPVSASPRASSSPTSDVTKRMNNVVQWARTRFNECLEKSEVVGRRLVDAQRKLPETHPAHPNNHTTSSGSAGAISASSGDQIQITSGTTAERLMFERAVEMSRAAAVNELVGEELQDCELGYRTAIMLFEAVLEADDEPLMRKPSAKKDKAADERVKGIEGEERQTVIKLIEGSRARLSALRKKLVQQIQQQTQPAVKRHSSSSNTSAYRVPTSPVTSLQPGSVPRS
ncbi:hypothetical protein MRB53_042053 [Persea americana]|nr:hypothetical protein MRB53_042053 [Persea americana]